MPEYQTRLSERSDVAAGTLSFRLEKTAGFVFRPGQSADLTLLSPRETDYASRRPEDSAFLRELQDMAGLHAGLHLVATMSKAGKSKQPGEGGGD